ncbi:MAG: hypothetical protein HUU38_31300 [Anaerolineales bacterium]|nr:hypothetical protein [Anaerolineales bacterium]
MNNQVPPLLRWLTFAALLDWLITRTLTRAGVFIPKSPAWITVYQVTAGFGQGASTLAGLLALAALGWVAWQEWQSRRNRVFPLILGGLGGLSLLFLFIPAVGWLAVANHVLLLIAFSIFFWRVRRHLWLLLPLLALMISSLYQLIPSLYETLHLPGPPAYGLMFFNIGEALVALSGVGFGWVAGRGATRREWLLAALPALVFMGMFLSVPAMAGIFSIWSVGLTLFLPWPLYVVSLWAASIALLKAFREKHVLGWVILLLAAGGYASQLSVQAFYGLIAMWILVYSLDEELPQQARLTTNPEKFQANIPVH